MDREMGRLVRRYGGEYGRDACLSSIVRSWLRSNNGCTPIVSRSHHIQRIAETPPAGDLEAQIVGITPQFSLKQAEAAFETLIDSKRKRVQGSVYTPNYVIDYILKKCSEIRPIANLPTLVDPACGSGGFLVRAIPLLSRQYGISKEKVINELVYGIDVSSDAIECTKLAIEMFCAENLTNPPPNFNFLLHEDTLLTTKDEIQNAFRTASDGFDIVVTNPPYVKLQNLDDRYRALLIKAYPEFTTGSFSLAMLFLIAGYRLLSGSGVLGYITQNNIYTSLAGEGVREFLQAHRSLHTIVDFGHKKVFPENSAYTCLMFLDRTPQETLRFRRCIEPEAQLPKLKSADFHDVQVSNLNKAKWRLAPAHHLKNIKLLETNGNPLGDVTHIRVGFATLKDSVFLVDHDPASSNIESEITKPAIKIAAFSDERQLKHNRVRVIQPYRKSGNRWVPLEEDELRQQYPKAYAHLKFHQTALVKRDKGKKSRLRFYEWGRSQCMEAPGPKLLTKTFNRGPNFLLDESDSLFCNGYSVEPRRVNNFIFASLDISVLQKILNSCVMDYYLKLTSFQIEGDYQCFQKNFIERFCIPEISAESADNIIGLSGTTLQEYLCDLFGLSVDEILEVVPHFATYASTRSREKFSDESLEKSCEKLAATNPSSRSSSIDV